MQLDREALEPTVAGIRRAEGELLDVVRMLEDGRECEDVVALLAAVSQALDRAGFALVTNGLQQCLAADGAEGDPGGGSGGMDAKKLEKLFLSLA